jgi:hypothetical protein
MLGDDKAVDPTYLAYNAIDKVFNYCFYTGNLSS